MSKRYAHLEAYLAAQPPPQVADALQALAAKADPVVLLHHLDRLQARLESAEEQLALHRAHAAQGLAAPGPLGLAPATTNQYAVEIELYG